MTDDEYEIILQENEARRRLYGRTRSERLMHARSLGTHTKQEWKVLHDVFGKCVGCGTAYDALIGDGATKDHITEICFGGCDCLANLQPLCRHCNSSGMFGDMREDALPGWQTIYLHRSGAYY